jgi:hypothetical protein
LEREKNLTGLTTAPLKARPSEAVAASVNKQGIIGEDEWGGCFDNAYKQYSPKVKFWSRDFFQKNRHPGRGDGYPLKERTKGVDRFAFLIWLIGRSVPVAHENKVKKTQVLLCIIQKNFGLLKPNHPKRAAWRKKLQPISLCEFAPD